MPLNIDYVILVVIGLVLVAMMVVSLHYFYRTRTWQGVALIAAVLVLAVSIVTLARTESVTDPYFDEQPATTTAEETVITTSPLPTSASSEPAEETTTATSAAREEKVSYVFMAEQFGLKSGAQHSLYVGDPKDSDLRMTNTDKERGYFVTTEDRHKQGHQESVTLLTYVDVNGKDINFSVENERIIYRKANYHQPRITISLEAGSEDEDIYGLTEIYRQKNSDDEESDECELAVNKDNPKELTCTWHSFGMAHDTTIDRDMYELGLGHVLENGIGAVFIDLSEQAYIDMTGEESFSG